MHLRAEMRFASQILQNDFFFVLKRLGCIVMLLTQQLFN
jgi:hypothetical protein